MFVKGYRNGLIFYGPKPIAKWPGISYPQSDFEILAINWPVDKAKTRNRRIMESPYLRANR